MYDMRYVIGFCLAVFAMYLVYGLLTPSVVDDSYQLNGMQLSAYLDETSDLLSSTGSLEHFGFSLIDCAFDDPTTTVVESSYFDEVSGFSNVSHLCAFAPDSDVTEKLGMYKHKAITALLYIENILFERVPGGELSGELVSLRDDYRKRWERFENVNQLSEWSDTTVLYLVDEPLWNSVPADELREVSDYLKQRLPNMKQFVVYSYATIDENFPPQPSSIDWLGYNQYGVPNPLTHEEYQSDLNVLEEVTNQEQEIILIFESIYLPLYSRYGFREEHLPTMTAHYYRLAVERQRVTGLIGYVWPNGFDGPDVKGARSLTHLHPLYQTLFSAIVAE